VLSDIEDVDEAKARKAVSSPYKFLQGIGSRYSGGRRISYRVSLN
jgi:hypothetical protein